MSIEEQRLIPVLVPWKVSPSTPFLRLRVSEADEPTTVTFMANFSTPLIAQDAVEVGFHRVQVVGPTAESGAVQETETSCWGIVKVVFRRGLWARFTPSHSDREVVKESSYDWSALPAVKLESFGEERRRLDSIWRESGLCPDPRFYVVSGSRWLQETTRAGSSFKHYMVLGHDAYVEVIAETATWQGQGSEPVSLELVVPSVVAFATRPPSPED
jgi:hypothetical protein